MSPGPLLRLARTQEALEDVTVRYRVLAFPPLVQPTEEDLVALADIHGRIVEVLFLSAIIIINLNKDALGNSKSRSDARQEKK